MPPQPSKTKAPISAAAPPSPSFKTLRRVTSQRAMLTNLAHEHIQRGGRDDEEQRIVAEGRRPARARCSSPGAPRRQAQTDAVASRQATAVQENYTPAFNP